MLFALQETKLDEHTPCPTSYVAHRTSFDQAIGPHGGCMIYIRRDIPHTPLVLQTQLQAVAIQVGLQRQYTVCSLYLPPNTPVSSDSLLHLMHQLPEPFIILGA